MVEAAPGLRAVLSRGGPVFGRVPVDHHARDGLYLLVAPGVAAGPGPRASIYDVAPTVLGFYGVPSPPDLEGEPLHDFGIAGAGEPFDAPLTFDGPANPAPVASPELDERLRALGYIE